MRIAPLGLLFSLVFICFQTSASDACYQLMGTEIDSELRAIYLGLAHRPFTERTPDLTVVADRLEELGDRRAAEILRWKVSRDPWEHWERTQYSRVRSEELARAFRRFVLPEYHRPELGLQVHEFGGRPLVQASAADLIAFRNNLDRQTKKALPPIFLLKITRGTDAELRGLFYHDGIPQFRHLKHLDIGDTDVTESFLHTMFLPSTLASFIVSARRRDMNSPGLLTSAGLERALDAGKFRHLRNLDVSNTAVSGSSFAHGNFPQLESLKATDLRPKMLYYLRPPRAQLTPDANTAAMTDEHLITAARAKKFDSLRYLDVSRSAATGTFLSDKHFPRLLTLNLSELNGQILAGTITDDILIQAAEGGALSQLVYLDIHYCPLNATVLAHPKLSASLEGLRTEHIYNVGPHLENAFANNRLQALTHLNAGTSLMQTEDVLLHKNFPKGLEFLDLRQMCPGIKDTRIAKALALGHLRNLKHLGLRSREVTWTLLQNADFPDALESLDLAYATLSFDGLESKAIAHLRLAEKRGKLRELRALDARGSGITANMLTTAAFTDTVIFLGTNVGDPVLGNARNLGRFGELAFLALAADVPLESRRQFPKLLSVEVNDP